MGKDWAKGLTAATDMRIARNGAARRGQRYKTKRHAARSFEWSLELAYGLGLTATDGCLSRDRRHITFDSKDRDLVETYLRCVGREDARILPTRTRTGGRAYRAAISDASLYDWLFARGIRPAKSLTLGAVEVPPNLLPHFLRGLIDGDGTIYVLRHRPTPKRYPDYWYVRLWTYFTSASRSHIEWLRDELRTSYGLNGYVERRVRKGRHDFYRLKFGKGDSLALLPMLYRDPGWPALQRKRRKWTSYIGTLRM